MKILNRSSRGEESKRGGVLILSLVAVGVVTIMSIAFMQLSATVTRRQVSAVDTKLAFYLAEAGLTEAYAGVMVGHTGNIGSEASPAVMGDGLLWVEAIELDDDHLQLTATAYARSGQATLGMVLRRGETNLGSLGVFSETDLTVPDGALIDGFDSSLGDYATQLAADPTSVQCGRASSNGNITVVEDLDTTIVHGDVITGSSGTVTEVGSPTISGNQSSHVALVKLNDVVIPEIPMIPGYTHPEGPPLVVPSGSVGAEYLHLAPNAETTLTGPLRLALNGLQLGAGSELTFDTTNGEILLWVSNYLDLDETSLLTNSTPDASHVVITVDGTATVDLDSDCSFYGLFYAPETTINLGAEFELYGGLIAEGLSLAPGSRLHYDKNLLAAGADEAMPVFLSWRIIQLPEGSPDTVGVDPFDLFGVDPMTAPRLSDSHEDQNMTLTWVDGGGATTTYAGLESGFDWSAVRAVTYLKRDGGLREEDIVTVANDGGLGFTIK